MNIVVILTHTLAQYTMYLTDRTNNLTTNIKSRKSYRTGAQGIRQLGSKGHVESQAQAVIDRTLKRSNYPDNHRQPHHPMPVTPHHNSHAPSHPAASQLQPLDTVHPSAQLPATVSILFRKLFRLQDL